MSFLVGQAAYHQKDRRAGGAAQHPAYGIHLLCANGLEATDSIVLHRYPLGIDAASLEQMLERTTDRYHARRRAQADSIELVIQPHLQISTCVAMMKRDPAVFSP